MPANRIKIPLPVALQMISGYAATRLREQVKAVAFIVAYLVVFQVLVFGRAPAQALRVGSGIVLVVLGLALFLEGLLLGLMPLAKRVGVRLSHRTGLRAILPIGCLVGLGSTLAEPSMAALRVAGRNIAAWEAPLLFFLLHRNPGWLILSIGIGVGVAVAIGMMRLYLDFSMKLLILPVLGVLLPISFLVSRSSELGAILGLAWDAGAITTGAVTVPLVLALGIGMSRQLGTVKGRVRGLGIVALASLFPVLAVIALGIAVLPHVPPPMEESEFFAPENREQVLGLFGTEEDFRDYALSLGSEESRRVFEEEQDVALDEHGTFLPEPLEGLRNRASLLAILVHDALQAARAVLPITIALGVLLLGLMRDRLGLLRITVPADKEVVRLLVPAMDAEGVMRMLIEKGQLNRPGKGFIYSSPVLHGLLDTSLLVGLQEHAATLEQVIAAIDQLHEGTAWRRRFPQLDPEAEFALQSACSEITIVCGEEQEARYVEAAMQAGAGGATTAGLQRMKPGETAGEFCERCVFVVSREMDRRVVDALVQAQKGADAPLLGLEVRPVTFAFAHRPENVRTLRKRLMTTPLGKQPRPRRQNTG